jgi:hypothetical protein
MATVDLSEQALDRARAIAMNTGLSVDEAIEMLLVEPPAERQRALAQQWIAIKAKSSTGAESDERTAAFHAALEALLTPADVTALQHWIIGSSHLAALLADLDLLACRYTASKKPGLFRFAGLPDTANENEIPRRASAEERSEGLRRWAGSFTAEPSLSARVDEILDEEARRDDQ